MTRWRTQGHSKEHRTRTATRGNVSLRRQFPLPVVIFLVMYSVAAVPNSDGKLWNALFQLWIDF